MNCRQIDDFILDYCENKLPDDLMSEIQEHISHCPFCCNNEKWTRLENKILQKPVEIPSLSDNFCTAVMQKLQALDEMSAIDKTNAIKRKTFYSAFSALAAVAVILLVVMIPTGLQNDKIPIRLAQNNSAKYEKTSIQSKILAGSKPDVAAEHDIDQGGGGTDISSKEQAANESIEIQTLPPGEEIRRDIIAGSRALSSYDKTISAPVSSDAIIPEGIPSEYHLVKNVTENNSNVYYYSCDGERPDSNISLIITISEAPEINNMNIEDAAGTSMSIASMPAKNNRTIEYGGKVYSVELKMLSNGEESTQLLDSIVLTPSSNTIQNP